MITHDLLMAADKYDIPGLVNVCINFMKENLNDENVVKVMTSAYLTNQKELFRMACKFVFKRGADDQIVQIEAWKEFKEKDPVLANKMLEEAMFNLNAGTYKDVGTGPRQVFPSKEANPVPSKFALPSPQQNFRHSGGPEHYTSE